MNNKAKQEEKDISIAYLLVAVISCVTIYILHKSTPGVYNIEFRPNLLIEIVGAIIAAGATIWGIYLTFRNENRRQYVIKLKEQNEDNIYLKEIITICLIDLDKIISDLHKFNRKFRKRVYSIPEFKLIASHNIIRALATINNEKHFHSYLSEKEDPHKRVKEYFNISSALDYFHMQYNDLPKIIVSAKKAEHKRRIHFKEIFDSRSDAIDNLRDYLTANNYHKELNDVNNIIASFTYKFIGQNQSNLDFIHNNFVMPLIQCILNNANFPNCPEGKIFFKILTDLEQVYKDLIFNNTIKLKEIAQLESDFKETKKKFLNNCDQLFKEKFSTFKLY